MSFELTDSNPNLSLLQQQILSALGPGPMSMEDIQNFTLLETVYKKVHAKQAVDALEARHKVECQKTKAYANYIVRLAPPSLFG
jgi:hypothetical protein